ncbi:MAG: vitamin K epoxide reductase family protein [Bacteroidota bacterium]
MLNLSLTKHDNAIAVSAALIQTLKIKVSSFTLKKTLTSHPEYPSLLAISDSLNAWNVPHTNVKIQKLTYKDSVLKFPFIAHLNAKEFILVHSIMGSTVTFSNEERKEAKMDEDVFLHLWDGIVLYAEKGEASGEADFKRARLEGWLVKARIPFLIMIILGCFFSVVNYSIPTWYYFVLLALKLSGISLTVLLLAHSVDANNPFIQNLCSLGKKNNCNAVLKSDAAKVTTWLSWSEVGFFYYAGGFLSLLFAPTSLPLLAFLNLFALPYTLYSIHYQFKQKNWCILCCTVQVLLCLEALAFTFQSQYGLNLSLVSPILVIFAFLLPIATWSVLRPLLLKAEQAVPMTKQLKKFKYNSELFQQMLTAQARYIVTDELRPIVLGNLESETTITMVSNPFCGPCGTAHRAIEEWLNESNDFKLQIVFTTVNRDNDERTKVARHLTALNIHQDKRVVEKALNDWYSQTNKKYEVWAESYPISFNGEISIAIEKQQRWCELAEIEFTPTILVNGYKLPELYRLEDLKYLIN